MNRFHIPEKVLRWLPLLFALAFFAQGLFGSLEKSLTWDEPTFIASGYTYLTRNDFRMNPEAPPLMQHLEALPLLLMDLDVPGQDHWTWKFKSQVQFGREILLQNAEKVRSIAFWARLPVLLLGAVLILAIASWGRRLYGPGPALVAVAAAAFSPNLLAHAKLATTDLGCTVFMFLSVFTFHQALRTHRVRDWTLCGLVTGLALLAKFTSLLLGPIYLILAAVHLIRNRTKSVALIRGLLIAGGITVLVVGAGYNLSFNPLLYVQGLREIYIKTTPGYLYYLLGEVSDSPFWHYHIVAFLLKVPLPILLLLGLAVFAFIRQPHQWEDALFLLLPALTVIGASCFDQANLGLRRILPAFPFLLLFTAQTLSGSRGRLWSRAVLLLLLWTGVEAVRIYPHHLAYFNQAAGGPQRAPYLLDDSNIDWGQDLPALAAWQKAHPNAGPLKLFYFGTAPPQAYGVQAQDMENQDIMRPGGGVFAVSVHNLVWTRKLYKQGRIPSDWLTAYRPIDRAGYSIYLYRFP